MRPEGFLTISIFFSIISVVAIKEAKNAITISNMPLTKLLRIENQLFPLTDRTEMRFRNDIFTNQDSRTISQLLSHLVRYFEFLRGNLMISIRTSSSQQFLLNIAFLTSD